MPIGLGSEESAEVDRICEELAPQGFALWLDIGRRLLVGQARYGEFKFGEVDLDQMALEEIEDFVVYRAALRYIERTKWRK